MTSTQRILDWLLNGFIVVAAWYSYQVYGPSMASIVFGIVLSLIIVGMTALVYWLIKRTPLSFNAALRIFRLLVFFFVLISLKQATETILLQSSIRG